MTTYCISFNVNAVLNDEQSEFLQEEIDFSEDFFNNDGAELIPFESFDIVRLNYQSVLNLIQQNKFEQAKEKVASLIQSDPDQALYFNLKAVLEVKDKKFDLAEKSYKQALNLQANNTQAYLGLAAIALEKKQFSIANKYANKILEQDPTNASAYMILAKTAMQQQGIAAVEKQFLIAFDKVKGNFQSELMILNLLSQLYTSQKQAEKTVPLARELVVRNEDNVVALSVLAGTLLANQDDREAEKILRKIISLKPSDVKHRVVLARLLSKQTGNDTEVLALLDQAALQNEGTSNVLALKVAFLVKKEKYQQALLVAQQIDKAYPGQSIGKVSTGDVYLAEKKYDEALSAYQKAYQIDNNPKVLGFIIKLLVTQDKHQEAIGMLKNELAKNKENAAIEFKLANLYQVTGQYDLAIKHYEVLHAKQKDNTLVLNNLAWTYGHQGNPKALGLAKQAYQQAPKSAVVADTYGYILLQNGHKQDSLQVLQKAAKMAPKLGEIQLHLAEAYIANQNKSQAREILQQLINQNGVEKKQATQLMEKL